MIRKFVITWMSLVILKIIDGHSLATFRQLEKLWIKKTRILCHLDFNITCDNCDLLPIYTNLKILAIVASAHIWTNFGLILNSDPNQ